MIAKVRRRATSRPSADCGAPGEAAAAAAACASSARRALFIGWIWQRMAAGSRALCSDVRAACLFSSPRNGGEANSQRSAPRIVCGAGCAVVQLPPVPKTPEEPGRAERRAFWPARQGRPDEMAKRSERIAEGTRLLASPRPRVTETNDKSRPRIRRSARGVCRLAPCSPTQTSLRSLRKLDCVWRQGCYPPLVPGPTSRRDATAWASAARATSARPQRPPLPAPRLVKTLIRRPRQPGRDAATMPAEDGKIMIIFLDRFPRHVRTGQPIAARKEPATLAGFLASPIARLAIIPGPTSRGCFQCGCFQRRRTEGRAGFQVREIRDPGLVLVGPENVDGEAVHNSSFCSIATTTCRNSGIERVAIFHMIKSSTRS